MTLSRLLSLAAAATGSAAALRVLARRHHWEQTNRRAAICVDLGDAQAAAVRAGLPLDAMLARLAEAGATHLSLPEWTLADLLASGQLAPQAPARPRAAAPPVGHWNYLHGDPGLVAQLAAELNARLPQTETAVIDDATLVFAGSIPTIGEIGLGFDRQLAARIRRHGLGVVPRPVSYAWPDPALLARTLAQAAAVGRYVAFAGEMILGHEMHLDATVQALADNDLTFVYFAESRHQKGDWFIAKRRAPHLVLGHQLTPAEMVPLDYHAACHNWAHLARERGIRFCYVNFFRVLHATAPLEGLAYVHHLKHALEDAGYQVSADAAPPAPVAPPAAPELAAAALAAGGAGAAAVSGLLKLPESLAVPLTLAAAAGAAALPVAEQAWQRRAVARAHHHHDHSHHHHHHDDPDHAGGHDHEDSGHGRHDHDPDRHEHDHAHHDHDHDHDHGSLQVLYPPSYAPKLLGLGAAVLGPVAAARAGGLEGSLYQAAATLALSAVTSGEAYQLRIEAYRGFNLDWLLPLGAAAWQLPDARARTAALAALAAGWLAARQRGADLLAALGPDHAEGHTHHISAAMALLGDAQMALGPRPARKWAGLGPLAGGLSVLLAAHQRPGAAGAARLLAAAGYTLGLASFRQPERALAQTMRLAGPSLALGTAVGLLLHRMGHDRASG